MMWFRRDLRLRDNPALVAAADGAGRDGAVVGLFCLDDRLRSASGAARLAYLYRTLRELDDALDGRLVVRTGAPAEVVVRLASEVEATTVYAARDFGPYGSRRDERVARALAGEAVDLVLVGSSYAVDPGSVTRDNGAPFKVFTPFHRAWRTHGWPAPVRAPRSVQWGNGIRSDRIPEDPPCSAALPAPGENAARRAARRFWDRDLDRYDGQRDFPGADATSRLSPYLKYGALHPRQLLAQLGRSRAHETFAKELCWREFYADVLWRRPDTVHQSLDERMRRMEVDEGPGTDERFQTWVDGRTGYPLVDAGMRQLAAEAWMHNRVRMVVASFLVKDLHLDWGRGARLFMQRLVDGDLASNHHGWQWTAGTGTDPAPYFRVFNPVSQSEKFDPEGQYIRRYVPELRDVTTRYVHRPWEDPQGLPAGYPERIVDHADERAESLRRYGAVTGRRPIR